MTGQPVLDYPHPDLSDGVVKLRRWTMDDLGCVEQAAQDSRIPEGTTVPADFTPDRGREYISRQLGRQIKGDGLSLAISSVGTGEAMGMVVLMLRDVEATAEIGYWIVPGQRGRGLATRAIRLVSRWAVQEAGFARVGARVMPDNEPSLRALQKCGFVVEGILRSHYYSVGRHHDMVSLSLVPADLEAE